MSENEKAGAIRILVVDDHEVVRLGLRSLLDGRGRFRVVGEAGTAGAAVEEAVEREPDVVIMDIRLSDGSGVDACREIRSRTPSVKVLMLTSYADDEAIFASIMAGASGYILKQIKSRPLLDAIEIVADGGSLLDSTVTRRILDRVRKGSAHVSERDPQSLTGQEERVLSLVAEGKTNREIAQALALSEGTVKNYVSGILSKLSLDRRSQLVAYALRDKPLALY